jgi:hypothetical protein
MSDPVKQPLPAETLATTEVIWSGSGAFGEMQATNIQSLLAASGIESTINGSTQIPSMAFEVLVTGDNVAAARQIIEDAIASGPAAAEEAERESELSSPQSSPE